MFDNLVEATYQIIQEQNFHPFVINFGNVHGQGFEVYWNTLIRNKLIEMGVQNINPVNRIVQGHGPRQFDLAWYQDNQWSVCEFGHERSGRGYLEGIAGPNNMGLINKWFFDYCRNYYQPNIPLNPYSYTYLYFSFENQVDIDQVDNLFALIENTLPENHNSQPIEVILGNIPVGRIIIIDCFHGFEQIRQMYQENQNIHDYVNPVEVNWNKHQLLMGLTENPRVNG